MVYRLRLIAIVIFTLSSNVIASDDVIYGMGISETRGFEIYFPIKFSHILIEPSIRVFDRKGSSNNDTFRRTNDWRWNSYGVGVFVDSEVKENTNVYYGLRVGYLESKNVNGSTTFGTSTFKEEGYFIAPTLGAYYNFISTFSVGIEVQVFYEKLKGKDTFTESTSVERTKDRNIDSRGGIIVRYYF